MASSSESETAAFLARGFGVVGDAAGAPDYRVLVPSLPTGVVTLNFVVLHRDVTGRPDQVLDFQAPLKSVGVLNDIECMGSFQMNHVWILTMKSLSAKMKVLGAKEFVVKGKRCLVLDLNRAKIRLKVHWVPFHATNDTIKSALEALGKVEETTREMER